MTRGRPPLPKGESKEASLCLRLKPDEMQTVQDSATKAGVDVSAWVRDALFSEKSKKPLERGGFWSFQHGSEWIHLEHSELSVESWEKLRAFVDVIKPTASERKAGDDNGQR